MMSAALEYASLGWPVLPIAPRGKIPLTAHGLKDATTDHDAIVEWFTTWPTANVGIATGPPGPTVIDCDGPIGKHEWMKQVDGIGWRSAPWCSTGGGGWHVYFVGDDTIRNRAGWLLKVDIRGAGGYVCAPPSIHSSGADYWWVHGPDERAVHPLPELVRDALSASARTGPVYANTSTLRVARSIGSKYAAAALDGELDKVLAAPVGQRNAILVAAAFSLGQLVAVRKLEAGQVVGALLTAASVAGLSVLEASRTITSGMRAGIDQPRNR